MIRLQEWGKAESAGDGQTPFNEQMADEACRRIDAQLAKIKQDLAQEERAERNAILVEACMFFLVLILTGALAHVGLFLLLRWLNGA